MKFVFSLGRGKVLIHFNILLFLSHGLMKLLSVKYK